jgi:hypothetical protein
MFGPMLGKLIYYENIYKNENQISHKLIEQYYPLNRR